MWNSIFDPENFVFRALSWLVDVVGISFLWLVLSLPVVTAVPATAALYHVTALCIRRREEGAFGRYLRSFRDNLRQGCLLSVPVVLLGAALLWGREVMLAAARANGGYALALYGVYSVALLVPMGAACWLCPLLGRFAFKTGELVRTACLLALRHLPTTAVSVLLVLELIQACLRCIPLVLVLPVLGTLLLSLFLERVFVKYLPREETEDLPDRE